MASVHLPPSDARENLEALLPHGVESEEQPKQQAGEVTCQPESMGKPQTRAQEGAHSHL